jgi:hypothetical protein
VAVPTIEEKKVVTVAVPIIEEKKVVAKTYPTIQELQSEFKDKHPGIHFKNVPSYLIIESVYDGFGVSDGGQRAWSRFLKERAYKILKEDGMWSQRLNDDMWYWTEKVTRSLRYWNIREKQFLEGYLWYTNALCMLSDMMPIEWAGRLGETAFYREAVRKELAGEKEYDSDEDDEDSDDDSYEDSEEEEDEEEEEVAVAIPNIEEKKVVAIPTIEEQIDALRRLRYNLQRLNV